MWTWIARNATLDARGPAGSTADFFVLLDQHAAVESVKFIGGDERLRPMADALRAAKYKLLFPDDTPAKVLRRGTVSCSSESARPAFRFVLMSVVDVQAAEQYLR